MFFLSYCKGIKVCLLTSAHCSDHVNSIGWWSIGNKVLWKWRRCPI